VSIEIKPHKIPGHEVLIKDASKEMICSNRVSRHPFSYASKLNAIQTSGKELYR
jgi:hypothetical protein